MSFLDGRVSIVTQLSYLPIFFLNYNFLAACHLSNICKTDKSNNRKLYREVFVPGVLAAFFGNFTQGNKDIIKHIVTRDLMPVELGDLKADLCTQ